MKCIRLYKHNGLIVADHIDEYEKPDKEIIELFGTHILPTNCGSNLNEAKERIQNLNNDKVVVIL